MVERSYDVHLAADIIRAHSRDNTAIVDSATGAYERQGYESSKASRTASESGGFILAGLDSDFQIVDYSAKAKFRSARDSDPSGEIQQRVLDGMQRRIEEGPDHKTSRWQDGAVTRVDHHDQSLTYMDPSGDAMRQNADGSMVAGKIKNPAGFDGRSSDPQLELERRVHNGDRNAYTKSETQDGRNVTYKFNDGTSLFMDRLSGKLTFMDKQGNSWTRQEH